MKLWLLLSLTSYSVSKCASGAITEFSNDLGISVSIFFIYFALFQLVAVNYLY